MAKNYTEINQEQRQFGSAYRKASPDTMNAFLALHKAAMREGELSVKHKELIMYRTLSGKRINNTV